MKGYWGTVDANSQFCAGGIRSRGAGLVPHRGMSSPARRLIPTFYGQAMPRQHDACQGQPEAEQG